MKTYRFLFIDATAIFCRGFYGGKHDPLNYFMDSLEYYLKSIVYLHAMLFWDAPWSGDLRRALYPQYKSNRPQKDASYWDLVEACCVRAGNMRGVSCLLPKSGEADDAIYTAANSFPGINIVLSPDKDLVQCVNGMTDWARIPNISKIATIDTIDKSSFTYEGVEVRLNPRGWLLLQSLCGDKSDGYHGIKKVNPRKGIKLINEHRGLIENIILNNNDEIDKIKLIFKELEINDCNKDACLLIDFKDEIVRNYNLAKLNMVELMDYTGGVFNENRES